MEFNEKTYLLFKLGGLCLCARLGSLLCVQGLDLTYVLGGHFHLGWLRGPWTVSLFWIWR